MLELETLTATSILVTTPVVAVNETERFHPSVIGLNHPVLEDTMKTAACPAAISSFTCNFTTLSLVLSSFVKLPVPIDVTLILAPQRV